MAHNMARPFNNRQQHFKQHPQSPRSNYDPRAQYLGDLARTIIPQTEITQSEFQRCDAFLHRLRLALHDVTSPLGQAGTVSLHGFGSLRSGFATAGSDMDLVIVNEATESGAVEDGHLSLHEDGLPRRLEKYLLDRGIGARLLTRTRVPIIKLCESPGEELLERLRAERLRWDGLPDEEKYNLKDATVTRESTALEELADGDSATRDGVRADEPRSSQASGTKDLSQSPAPIDTVTCPNPDEVSTNSTSNALKGGERTGPSARAGSTISRSNGSTRPNLPEAVSKIGNSDSSPTSISDGASTVNSSAGSTDHGSLTIRVRLPKDAIPASSAVVANGQQPTRVAAVSAGEPKIDENSSATKANLHEHPSLPLDPAHDPDQRSKPPQKPRQWMRKKEKGPLDFPDTGVGIQSDINFFNPLGLHNTHLLYCYSLCDPRVRPMVLFVKAWARRRKINTSYSGTLSSYGFVLMVLHYLMNVARPPVLPNLQLEAQRMNSPGRMVEGWEVRFWHDTDAIVNMARSGRLTRNQESLGALLKSFFQYFAVTSGGFGFVWMRDVLSLRTPGGIVSKHAKGWTGAKTENMDTRQVRHRYLFAIEDPFEQSHNVARTVTHAGIVAIRDEFRRAYRVLGAIGNGWVPNDGQLMDELVEVVEPDQEREQPHETANPPSPPKGVDRVTEPAQVAPDRGEDVARLRKDGLPAPREPARHPGKEPQSSNAEVRRV